MAYENKVAPHPLLPREMPPLPYPSSLSTLFEPTIYPEILSMIRVPSLTSIKDTQHIPAIPYQLPVNPQRTGGGPPWTPEVFFLRRDITVLTCFT